MNIKTYFELKIKVKDFNDVMKDPSLLKNLRELTLNFGSGMNHELNNIEDQYKIREVNAKAILAYKKKELVGWALLSKEASDYSFINEEGFKPSMGSMFQVYIHPNHRRIGIGSILMRYGRRHAGPNTLCIVPWDDTSRGFYSNFEHYKHKKL
jgi:GNAT superfamily N-acetyltransferase